MPAMLLSSVRRPLFLLAAALFFSSSCGGLNIPKPDFGTIEAPPDPVMEPSEIEIPIRVELSPILEKAESAVPKEIISKGWEVVATLPMGDIGVNYRLWRDPLRIKFQGNSVAVSVHAYYRLDVGSRIKSGFLGKEYPWIQFGSCGGGSEAPREIVFNLATKLNWSHKWRIESHTAILQNSYPVRCNLTALSVDVTRAIDADIRPKLESLAATLDQKLAEQTDISKIADDSWAKLSQPFEIEENVWLAPNPDEIYVTPLTGTMETIETTLGIIAHPQVISGRKPSPRKVPLPPLKVAQGRNGRFRIALKGELDFDVAARQLEKRLSNGPIDIGSQKLTISAVNIYPSGELCVIQLRLKGTTAGTVYLTAKPVYDEGKDELTLENLDYTLETKNALQKIGDWMVHDNFRNRIRKTANFKIGGALEKTRQQLQSGLSKSVDEHISIQTNLSDLKLKNFYMTSTSFRAIVIAEGATQVTYK